MDDDENFVCRLLMLLKINSVNFPKSIFHVTCNYGDIAFKLHQHGIQRKRLQSLLNHEVSQINISNTELHLPETSFIRLVPKEDAYYLNFLESLGEFLSVRN